MAGGLEATCARLSRMMTLGFRGSRSRQMKRFVVFQWLIAILILYLWVRLNGGLWPSFLRSKSAVSSHKRLDINLLDYFLSAQLDGSGVIWAHAVNSREAVKQVLAGDVMMIEADVILRGQNTLSQQMTPIMGRVSEDEGDLTLSEWLGLVKGHGKGLKLDFKSIEAVELSLQKLEESKAELNVPIHLSAAVVDGADGQVSSIQPVDAVRFLRLCTTHFPDSSLALGWATGKPDASSSTRVSRFSWYSVKKMYDLIEKWHVRQPITFNVYATLARGSLPQLKWLMEMVPGSTLTVISSSSSDGTSVNDLLYFRHRLPKHSVFYDIPKSLRKHFDSVKNDLTREPLAQVAVDEAQFFVADQWKVVKSREGETIYLGTESVILQSGLLITKAEYPATPSDSVIISGRVEFFDDDKSSVNSSSNDKVGFSVFLRATQASRPDSISGIRCFFGISGEVRISTRGIPGAEAESHAALPGAAPCFAFNIDDHGSGGITVRASRPKSCDSNFNLEYDVDFDAKVVLSTASIATEESYIAIKQSVQVGFAAVDRFTIHTMHPIA